MPDGHEPNARSRGQLHDGIGDRNAVVVLSYPRATVHRLGSAIDESHQDLPDHG